MSLMNLILKGTIVSVTNIQCDEHQPFLLAILQIGLMVLVKWADCLVVVNGYFYFTETTCWCQNLNCFVFSK